MNRIWLRVTLVLLLLALASSTADAQRRGRRRPAGIQESGVRFGPHVGHNFDVEELVVGAQLSMSVTPDLDLYPTFDYYLVDTGSLWALNLDLKYRPPTRFGFWYLGGGLNYMRVSNGTSSGDTNLNLLTGLEGRRGRTSPYVEARFTFADNTFFQIVGGISWR